MKNKYICTTWPNYSIETIRQFLSLKMSEGGSSNELPQSATLCIGVGMDQLIILLPQK